MLRPSRNTLRWTLGIAALLAILGAVWNGWTHRELAAAEARIVAAGLPHELAAIRVPTVPAGQNAAAEISQIRTLIENPAGVIEELTNFAKATREPALDAAGVEELAQLLATAPAPEIHALALAATAKGRYDAQFDLAEGFALKNPNIAPIRAAANLLRSHARLAGARGELAAAWADVWAGFALADFGDSEPLLISQLIRYTCLQVAIEALEHLAAAGGLDAEWSERFATRLEAVAIRAEFLRALDGERISCGGPAFHSLIANPGDAAGLLGSDHAGPWFRLIPAGYLRLEYAEYLDRMREVRLELARPASSRSAQLRRLEEIESGSERKNLLVGMVMPGIAAMASRHFEFEARLAVARIGLALHRYRLRHGHPPDTLAALAPDFLPTANPSDPLTGLPMPYRRTGPSARVYSLGKNGRDDGGTFDHDAGKDDLAWTSSPPWR